MERENRSSLEKRYVAEVRPSLVTALGLRNSMEVPKLSKIVLNIGVKRAVGDSKTFQMVEQTLSAIAGQAARKTLARKSIASFKIRDGMPVGVCVTLRRRRMYDFLDKFIRLCLPKVRDFQGVSRTFDGSGNYNLGVRDWSIFPEADDLSLTASFGMNISIHTTAQDDKHAYELLKQLGMPFKK